MMPGRSSTGTASFRRSARGEALVIRPVLTEIALFLVPFAVYVIFLWATRARVLDWANWSLLAGVLAGDRGAHPDGRQLHPARAFRR